MADGENPGKRRRIKLETNTYIEAPERYAYREVPMNGHRETPEINTYSETQERNTYRETLEMNTDTEAPELIVHRETSERNAYRETPERNIDTESPKSNEHKETSERNAYRKSPEMNAYKEALEQIANLFDNKLGNRHSRPSRPDDTEWRLQRVCTIRILNKFREKLDTVCVGPNSEKTLVNGAENEGAASSIVGTAKSLFGLTCSPWVTSIGNSLTSIPLVANIGRLVNETGTSIGRVPNKIESHISEKNLREIEAALEEDRTLIRPLAEWLNLSNELDAKVQEIFGVSLISGTFNNVIKVFHEILKLSNSDKDFDDIISLLERGKFAAYIGDFVKVDKLEKFYQCLSAAPKLADRIRRIFFTLSSQPEDVQVFVDGVRAYHSIMGTSSSSAVPTFHGGRNLQTSTTTGEVCVLQTIKLALSVISLINAASIIRRGTSQYSEPLKQLISSLAWELERIENL